MSLVVFINEPVFVNVNCKHPNVNVQCCNTKFRTVQDSAFWTVWAARVLMKILVILHNHPTFESGST